MALLFHLERIEVIMRGFIAKLMEVDVSFHGKERSVHDSTQDKVKHGLNDDQRVVEGFQVLHEHHRHNTIPVYEHAQNTKNHLKRVWKLN